MAVQIPTLSGPQVRQRAIGTPQIQVVPESQPLADLAARVEAAGLSSPCLTIVGEVVRLRESLEWFETAAQQAPAEAPVSEAFA